MTFASYAVYVDHVVRTPTLAELEHSGFSWKPTPITEPPPIVCRRTQLRIPKHSTCIHTLITSWIAANLRACAAARLSVVTTHAESRKINRLAASYAQRLQQKSAPPSALTQPPGSTRGVPRP